jgi:allantoinase
MVDDQSFKTEITILTLYSKVEEFPAVSPADVALAMQTLALVPTTLLFHAEMESPGVTKTLNAPHVDSSEDAGLSTVYNSFLASRPPSFETDAITEILNLAPIAPNLRLHIVHLSAHEALPILREARQKGINITAETCFHYLALTSEDIAGGDTRHKCCPPIRNEQNRRKLWDELARKDSVIQTIVSDHSPCTPELKLLPPHLEKSAGLKTPQSSETVSSCDSENAGPLKGDFFKAWGGVASVGLGLPILWTTIQALGLDEHISVTDIVRWCCVNTASQVGLEHEKGCLRAGMDADICVFDDEGYFTVEHSSLLFRNKVTPYEGKTLKGVVRETYLGGQRIFSKDNGGMDEKKGPLGKLLLGN